MKRINSLFIIIITGLIVLTAAAPIPAFWEKKAQDRHSLEVKSEKKVVNETKPSSVIVGISSETAKKIDK